MLNSVKGTVKVSSSFSWMFTTAINKDFLLNGYCSTSELACSYIFTIAKPG